MATANDFPARGRISDIGNGQLTFRPTNTNYEIHVQIPASFSTPGDTLVDGAITVNARKVWTVPSGGNFIAPIFGPPKTIQGRVKYVDQKQIVVQAGVPVIVKMTPDRLATIRRAALRAVRKFACV